MKDVAREQFAIDLFNAYRKWGEGSGTWFWATSFNDLEEKGRKFWDKAAQTIIDMVEGNRE